MCWWPPGLSPKLLHQPSFSTAADWEFTEHIVGAQTGIPFLLRHSGVLSYCATLRLNKELITQDSLGINHIDCGGPLTFIHPHAKISTCMWNTFITMKWIVVVIFFSVKTLQTSMHLGHSYDLFVCFFKKPTVAWVCMAELCFFFSSSLSLFFIFSDQL